MTTYRRNNPSVLFLELNEAEKYFIDKSSAGQVAGVQTDDEGRGCLEKTSIPGFEGAEREWRRSPSWNYMASVLQKPG